ncbi:MAG: peptidase S10 [Alphaproteobacteria bacterium]|nr:peptidase S10 [Alphaproteobacteria bacterium]
MSEAGESAALEERATQVRRTAAVDGREITYTARAETLVLRHDPDNPIGDVAGLAPGQPLAEIFVTSYTLDGGDGAAGRPVTFAFNGGPGSSSAWLHLGLLGPRRMPVTAGRTIPPFALIDNEFSLLSESDIVLIDPVSTGFSRIAPGVDVARFLDVEPDVQLVAAAILRWIAANGRWLSPKYILGESYGGIRGPLLVRHLQARHNVFPSGLILISPALDYGALRFHPGNDLPCMTFLPTYAAAGWFHRGGAEGGAAALHARVAEAEAFASSDYALALLHGDRLSAAARGEVARRIAGLTGLAPEFVAHANLRISEPRFRRELLKDRRQLIGRADARFTAIDSDPTGAPITPDDDASVYIVVGAPYAAALNAYVRDDLGHAPQRRYEIFHPTVKNEWKYAAWRNRYVNVGEALRTEICRNPRLRVYVATGLFDLATPHFQADYALDHLGLDASQRAAITTARFDAGHMMYIHDESLARLARDLRAFVRSGGE